MIRNYLEHLTKITSGDQLEFYSWLLKVGKSYTEDEERTKEIIESNSVLSKEIKVKECFRNSLYASFMCNDPMDYVEGYYITDITDMPFDHAFNTEKEEVSIDFTTEKFGFKVKERFGVIIPNEIVNEYRSETSNYYSCLLYYFHTYVKPGLN